MTSIRKLIFVTFFLFMGCMFAFASPVLYVAPEKGSYNVDMGSVKYPERTEHQPLRRYEDGLFTDSVSYSPYTCLAAIGVSGYNTDRQSDGSQAPYTIRFRVDSGSMGFTYISGSVPGASRPYRLYAVVNYRSENKRANLPADVFEIMPDTIYEISPETLQSKLSATDGEMTDVWIDVLLCLPGSDTIKDGILLHNGRRYMLATANDYVTSMGFRISLRDPETLEERYSHSEHKIFGGFYKTPTDLTSNNCMLLINPIGAGYRLNLLRYGSITTVAELGFRLRYTQRTRDFRVTAHAITDVGYHPDTATVFLSSSPDPFVQGSKFTFVHKSNPSILTQANSIGFDIMVTSRDAGNSGVTIFDGTDWYNTSTGGVDGNSLPVMYREQYVYHNGEYTAWATYDGEISVRLGNNGDTLLQSGIYESHVYVHVITDENSRTDQISWFY